MLSRSACLSGIGWVICGNPKNLMPVKVGFIRDFAPVLLGLLLSMAIVLKSKLFKMGYHGVWCPTDRTRQNPTCQN